MAARGSNGGRAATGGVGREVDREDGEFARHVGVRGGVLLADADVANAITEDRGAEELVP
jgi:hypothetical protein